MKILGRKEPTLLLAVDLLCFIVSLWLSLYLRNFMLPGSRLFYTHLVPFTLLFFVWITVFYIAGLYGKHTLLLRSKLPSTLLNATLANSIIAVVFFYLIPFFGITPKTILFIYLGVSFLLVLLWRMYGYFFLMSSKSDNAIVIGSGNEMREIYNEVNQNNIYNIHFLPIVDLSMANKNGFWDEVVSRVYKEDVSVVAIDLSDERVEPILPYLYNLIFSKVTFLDMHKIYEDIFDRVPLSILKYDWFLENISTHRRSAYDSLKRLMDIVFSFVLGAISLLFYPFVVLAIKLEDAGPVFITQERVGQENKMVKIHKFRSMSKNDQGEYRSLSLVPNVVTRVGAFLRKSRIDELPQLWNVLKGDISLIGPRPELPALAKLYEKEIPYYNVRHIIKPGLSGWAQIHQENHPHHKEAILETKEKLTYDLYYIKERSLFLDLKIALRTVKTLLSRVGV